MKYISLLLIFLFFSCNDYSDIMPCLELVEIDSYHCYPYTVRVFEVIELDNDKFTNFPTKEFCSDDKDYSLCKWVKYNELDSSKQNIWIEKLGKCVGNNLLQKEILQRDEVYFSGCYKLTKTKNKSIVEDYYKVVFFNKDSMKLHIFKDIDHYPFY